MQKYISIYFSDLSGYLGVFGLVNTLIQKL